jgi:hypothetical protein
MMIQVIKVDDLYGQLRVHREIQIHVQTCSDEELRIIKPIGEEVNLQH